MTQNKRQLGPRVNEELAERFEWAVKKRNDGKYKGRLSDEVENAFELYLGRLITENPEWLNDLEDERPELQEGFEEDADTYKQACAHAPFGPDVATSEDVEDVKSDLQAVKQTTTTMMSQIISQLEKSAESQEKLAAATVHEAIEKTQDEEDVPT